MQVLGRSLIASLGFAFVLSALAGDFARVAATDGETQDSANFVRGDADGNARVNITDAVLILQVAFGTRDARYDCPDALDTDDNGRVTIGDALPVLSWLFAAGEPLPSPFAECGIDPTADELSCPEAAPACVPVR